MKNVIRLTLFVLFLAVVRPSHSATLWVGDSPECSGSNVFETLDSALFVAALNSDGANEIRLTNTITYTGNGPGSYQLTDWTAGGFGSLTIVGGYSNCFAASPTVLTNIGDTGSPIFTIDTSVEAFSEITLRFLQLTGGRDRICNEFCGQEGFTLHATRLHLQVARCTPCMTHLQYTFTSTHESRASAGGRRRGVPRPAVARGSRAGELQVPSKLQAAACIACSL